MVMAISAAVPCSVCREHAKDTVPDQLELLAARGVTDPLDWTWHLREAVRTTRAKRAPPSSPMAWPPTADELRRRREERVVRAAEEAASKALTAAVVALREARKAIDG